MAPPEDEGEFSELVDADITSVHAVKGGANGTRWLIAKGADEQPTGLFDAEFVRELVAKADEEEAARGGGAVTVTGSPTAVAAMMARIHGASVRKAEKYDTKDRKRMASGGQAMDDGSYPIADAEDLDNAIHAVGRGGADHDAIRRHVIARAKALGASSKIPDNWASNGSLKQAVSKADGGNEPGDPAWEAQDASAAQSLIGQILALRPAVRALASREGTEVGAGHMDDLADVCDLQQVDDLLMSAAKLLGGFAVSERAEAGADVAKAQGAPTTTAAASAAPPPQESTVTDTQNGAQPADVAKSAAEQDALTEAEYARIGREFLRKMAADTATQTTGATAPGESARVIPGTETVQAPTQAPDDITKAATQLATVFADAMAPVTKQLGELVTEVKSQSDRVEKALSQPDDRRSPLLNGATGAPMTAPRGASPTQSPEIQSIVKAIGEMPEGPARDQAQKALAVAAIKGRFFPGS